MYCNDLLRHNHFKPVDVPKPSTLYRRLGFGTGTEKSSGDVYLDPSESKVQMAQNVSKEAERLEEEESSKSKK